MASRIDDPRFVVSPLYSVTQFTDRVYKVVKYKTQFTRAVAGGRRGSAESTGKFSQSLSRSRKIVLEKALCNKWDWFVTLTLDPSKVNRYDIDSFYKSFCDFCNNEKKRYGKFQYLIVPEQHKDGAWHFHGLLAGDLRISSFRDLSAAGGTYPRYLTDHDFYRWDPYHKRFGFCSLGSLRHPVASAFYVSKYVTKDDSSMVNQVNRRLFWASQGLNNAQKLCDIYEPDSFLDDLCVSNYEFCKVGFSKVADNVNALDFVSLAEFPEDYLLPLFDQIKTSDFFTDMSALNYEQMSFDY